MSKAILVVDTPRDCVCCPFKGSVEWFGSICIPYDSIHREELRRHLEITNGRPEWCPLKTYKDIIPIEWIEKYKRVRGWEVTVTTQNAIDNMLNAWEKENEQLAD